MYHPDQMARALGWSAIELSVLCFGVMTVAALANPQAGAVIVIIAALHCAALCMVYGRYVRRIWGKDSYIALIAMRMWLIASLAWLPVAL